MSLRTMMPAFELLWVPSNDATFTTASKCSGVPPGRYTAPYWLVACHTSAPAALTLKLLPSWSNVAAGLVKLTVDHGGRTPSSPTGKRPLGDVRVRPASLVATA